MNITRGDDFNLWGLAAVGAATTNTTHVQEVPHATVVAATGTDEDRQSQRAEGRPPIEVDTSSQRAVARHVDRDCQSPRMLCWKRTTCPCENREERNAGQEHILPNNMRAFEAPVASA
jgi:hypothetical protein